MSSIGILQELTLQEKPLLGHIQAALLPMRDMRYPRCIREVTGESASTWRIWNRTSHLDAYPYNIARWNVCHPHVLISGWSLILLTIHQSEFWWLDEFIINHTVSVLTIHPRLCFIFLPHLEFVDQKNPATKQKLLILNSWKLVKNGLPNRSTYFLPTKIIGIMLPLPMWFLGEEKVNCPTGIFTWSPWFMWENPSPTFFSPHGGKLLFIYIYI